MREEKRNRRACLLYLTGTPPARKNCYPNDEHKESNGRKYRRNNSNPFNHA